MDGGTVNGVAIAAAAVVILLAIFISFWICRRIRKRGDGTDSSFVSTIYHKILEQNGSLLPLYAPKVLPRRGFTVMQQRKKGADFYDGSKNVPPRNPPQKPK